MKGLVGIVDLHNTHSKAFCSSSSMFLLSISSRHLLTTSGCESYFFFLASIALRGDDDVDDADSDSRVHMDVCTHDRTDRRAGGKRIVITSIVLDKFSSC